MLNLLRKFGRFPIKISYETKHCYFPVFKFIIFTLVVRKLDATKEFYCKERINSLRLRNMREVETPRPRLQDDLLELI